MIFKLKNEREQNIMSRIYLVTGAAGFLGSNVCVQLLERGEKVRALVLPNDNQCQKIKFYLPLNWADKIARTLEKRAEKIGEKPMMTTFSVYNLARNNEFDYSKAQKELGYTTRSYKETIHDEVEWLRKEGLIGNM